MGPVIGTVGSAGALRRTRRVVVGSFGLFPRAELPMGVATPVTPRVPSWHFDQRVFIKKSSGVRGGGGEIFANAITVLIVLFKLLQVTVFAKCRVIAPFLPRVTEGLSAAVIIVNLTVSVESTVKFLKPM